SKIGLLEFDGFHTSDVSDWMNLLHLTSTNLSKQLSVVPIGGGVGSPGPGESEVLLDLDTIFSLNPAANIAVYEGGSGASFEQLFNAMINAHDTVISNSWAQCEDQTSPAEARAIDSVLSQAEASGITVFNGSGDNGTTCLDGSTNTVAVPADSPHALAVGGTTPVFGPALSYAGERWWGSGSNNPPDGQGGYGVSKYFSRPPYQSGVTSAGGRSVPDIVIDADPTAGIEICQADAGGCPDGLLSGGTSMAAPEIAALVAGLDQAAGRTLKIGPATAYGLAKTRPASFQTAAALKTDFAHVGLGFPDLNQWYMALTGTNTGSVSPNRSTAVGSIGMTGSKPTGAVSVMLRGTNGESVGGKRVSLTLVGGGHAVVVTTSGLSNPIDGSVTFAIRDSVPETVHFTVRDTTDKITLAHQPSVAFVSPSATAGSINATLLSVPADGKSSTTVTVTLQSAQGKPSAGKTVSVSEGAGHAIITGVGSQPGVTNSQGKAQFQVVDLTAETVTFTATDGSDGDLPVPGSATVVFTTGNGSNQCPAQTPTATKGFALSPFASGFFDGGLATFVGCGGVGTPAWDSSGNLYVPDFITGDIYKLGPGGGSPGPSTKITRTPLGPYLFGLAFGKKGELYADQWFTPSGSSVPCGCIYQVNPSTGAIERTVAQSVPLTSFSVDPISGDLFAFSGYNGGQNYNPDIYRIHDPGAGKPAVSCASPAPGTACSIYSTQGSLDYAVFDADGTIYARGCSTCGLNADTWMIDGTNSKTPGTATLLDSTIPGGGGPIVLKSGSGKKLAQIAIGDSSNSAAYMVDQVDLNRRPFRPVGLAQDLAPLTLGPDGCLYVEDSNSIFKLTTTGHTCPYPSPVSTRPGLTLTQSGPGGPTGSSVTLSARLQGVKNLAGNKITFSILGANTQGKLLASGSSGDARFTYQGIRPGVDTVMAMVMVGNKPLTSDSVYVHWAAGRHATFTGLNLSPQSGRVGQRLKFTASLTDITAGPAGPLGGQTVSLTLAGSHCGQKTDSHGLASCMLTLPSHAGTYVLQANFAGTSKYAGSSGRSGISVHGGASPVTVWLGYAAGKSKHFPNPWQGAKGIRFIGAEPLKGKTWDTSGLRIKNSSQRAIRITQVSVQFPATGYTASPWGALTVSAGQTVILASTNKANSGNFDGSENAVRGTKCDVVATKDAPTVEIAIQGQITQTYTDGGHVLDAGGYNPSYCKENESETWRLPGAAAGPFK
ncbi:MAG TPA: Ig-like domain-containing protein, partial [Chloroflexota bacterium]|nr:Ig-like domain-containing protein [Chloroflexota bacterium]